MVLKFIGGLIVLSLIPCVYLMVRKHQELKNSDQFEGTVIGHVPHSGGKSTTYGLKVQYLNQNETLTEFEASVASSPPARPIGAKVIVFQHRSGSAPDILVFESVYLLYWIWFCVGLCVAGCFLAPWVMNLLYRK
jgi:hypothetical protein